MQTSSGEDLVGRVLSDRYRLLRPLGSGASAQVYAAEDVVLRRRVALKVLHPALADDDSFGRRFESEARLVAGLRHPGILKVYDWGRDRDSTYLVTELLDGGSLRSLLDRGHLLTAAQVASVGSEVAQALAYAHRHDLVHRDVKPANLIFDDEGRVCIADFGLARALAEATWTEPAGVMVGTARYAAPEQVRGETLGDKADVYSLALVLVEAATGSVPFAADTRLGTLMGRLANPLVVPDDLAALRPALEAAGAPDPKERLGAADLAKALQEAGAKLPAAEPLPLAGPLATLRAEADPHPTQIHMGKVVSIRPGIHPALVDLTSHAPSGVDEDLLGGQPLGPELFDFEDVESGASPRRRRWRRRLAVGSAVLALAGGGVAGYLVYLQAKTKPAPPPPTYLVPRLAGESRPRADAVMAQAHLRLVVIGRSYDSGAKAGTVIRQRPRSGRRLAAGESVAVTLSLGPRPVEVPKLAGLSKADAESVVTSLGLKVGSLSSKASMTVPAGTVVAASPPGGTLLPGQPVDLVVSTGKPTVAVPSLSAADQSSFAAAAGAFDAAGLKVSEALVWDNNVAKGHLVSVSLPAGKVVTVGTAIRVVVSKGPDLVPVPNVYGDSVAAASQALAGQGFGVSGVSGNPTAPVKATTPAQGSEALKGASVQLITN